MNIYHQCFNVNKQPYLQYCNTDNISIAYLLNPYIVLLHINI